MTDNGQQSDLEAKRALLKKALKKKLAKPVAAPLTFGQKRLWFVDQLDPGNPLYNITFSFIARGELRLDLFQRAVEFLVDRHESLRTTIQMAEGEPVQMVHSVKACMPDFESLDYQSIPGQDRDERLARFIAEQNRSRMDLATGPLLKVAFLPISDHETVGCITMHHIISDGWSIGIFLSELSVAYVQLAEGGSIKLEPLTLRYRDFSKWQNEKLSGNRLNELIEYWCQRLEGAPQFLDLPTDHARPKQVSNHGADFRFQVSRRTVEALEKLSRSEGTTLFAAMLAGYASLLYRYSEQTDMLIGIPIAGRERQEVQPLIGYFVNMLPERVTLTAGMTYRELLQQVGHAAVETFAHQDVPFDKLVEVLSPKRASDRNPLVQVVYLYQNFPSFNQHKSTNLEIERLEIHPGFSRFEFGLRSEKCETGLACLIEYNTDLFDEQSIEQFSIHLRHFLDHAVANPDQPVDAISLTGTGEKPNRDLVLRTAEPSRPETRSIYEMFADHVAKRPDAIAIRLTGQQISYSELHNSVLRLRNRIVASQTVPEIVLVAGNASPETMAGILAASSLHATFALVDPRCLTKDGFPKPVTDQVTHCLVAPDVTEKQRTLINERFESSRLIELSFEPDLDAAAEPVAASEQPTNAAISFMTGDDLAPIEIPSADLEARIDDAMVQWELGPNAKFAVQYSPSRIDSLIALLAAIGSGAELNLVDKEKIDWEQLGQVDSIHISTDSVFEFLLNEPKPSFPPCRLIVSGNPLTNQAKQWITSLGWVASAQFQFQIPSSLGTGFLQNSLNTEFPADEGIYLGNAIRPDQFFVGDTQGQVVPDGLVGELCIAYSSNATERRTGSRVRKRHDGTFQYLGRYDNQIQLPCGLINPDIVKKKLLTSPAVADCHVGQVDHEHPDLKISSLVAYVVPGEGIAPNSDELAEFLSLHLPSWWIPDNFVLVESIHRSADGCVDESRFPVARVTRTHRVSPVTETEKSLGRVWIDVLGMDEPGIDDNFFSLGGNSLLAMQLMERISQTFNVQVPLHRAFQNPTIRAIAQLIDESRLDRNSSGYRIQPADDSEPKVLSSSQYMLWLIEQFEQGVALNAPVALKIDGPLNVDKLKNALNDVSDRHEILRSAIVIQDGQPVHQSQPARSVDFEIVDMSDKDNAQQQKQIELLGASLAERAFDLDKGHLVRYLLAKHGDQSYTLLIALHHLVSDGWSFGILFQEIIELYAAHCENRDAKLPKLEIQFTDYAIWQRNQKEDPDPKGYWKTRIGFSPPVLDLPTDFPRGKEINVEPEVCEFTIPKELVEGFNNISRGAETTLYTSLLSAFFVLLHRYSGQNDLVIGSATANRRSQTQDLIGFFASLLPVRSEIPKAARFNEFVEEISEVCQLALGATEPGLNELAQMMNPAGQGRMPICQALFTFAEFPANRVSQAGLEWTPSNLNVVRFSGFDIVLTLGHVEDELQGAFLYRPDLFRQETVEQMQRCFLELLRKLAGNPARSIDDFSILDNFDTKKTLVEWNSTKAFFPDACLHELFEQSVEKTPDATALIDSRRSISYHQLDILANRLMHHVSHQTEDSEQESLVGLLVPKSVEMIASILGILKAGAAYLPMDSSWPDERIQTVLNDSRCRVLVTTREFESRLEKIVNGVEASIDITLADEMETSDQEEATRNPAASTGANPSDLAYVIFTSGSTGNPKGVMLEHRSVVNVVHSFAQTYQLGPHDRVLQQASIAFDVSVNEIFPILISGGTLVLPSPGDTSDFSSMVELVKQHQITIMGATPTGLTEMNREAEHLKSLRLILSGGEQLAQSHVDRLVQLATVTNGYGPTETAICATFFNLNDLEPGAQTSIPIGKPLPNYRVYVVDQALQPVPIGVAGELCIAGVGLARGYLNDETLTRVKFVDNPFESGERMYRTGDEVRWQSDGNLEFLGRIDRQIKIRGFRVELGEIENTLQQLAMVQQAVVLTDQDAGGHDRIVAYLVINEDFAKEENLVNEIRKAARQTLPDYMVPTVIMMVEEFPLTANGKVDLSSLPKPIGKRSGLDEPFVEPGSKSEIAMAKIWSEVLGIDRVGRNDNFFDLGGHSLLAAQVMHRVQEQFGTVLPYRKFFDAPTIASTCHLIDASEPNVGESDSDRIRALNEHDLVEPTFDNQESQPQLEVVETGSQDVEIYRAALGPFQTNTYIVGCRKTKEAAIVDPAWSGEWLVEEVTRRGYRLTHVLLTHAHFDHFAGVAPLIRSTEAGFQVHQDCLEQLANGHLQASFFELTVEPAPNPDSTLKDGEVIQVGNLKMTALETPGHAPGHLCFHIASPSVVLVGDLVVKGGLGNSDLPGADRSMIKRSVELKLMPLSDETIVLPGHGDLTSIGDERPTVYR